MQPQGPATTLLALVLAACAPSGMTASQAHPHDKETTGMDTGTRANDHGAPTAEQLLEGLLRLIETSKDISDFTLERLEAQLGVPMKVSSDTQWGGSGKIDPLWWYGVSMEHAGSGRANLTLAFQPDRDGASPPMTSICGFDQAQFGARLVALGMQHETDFGEHGRILAEKYLRRGLEVEVLTRNEADEPDDKRLRRCVEAVIVR